MNHATVERNKHAPWKEENLGQKVLLTRLKIKHKMNQKYISD